VEDALVRLGLLVRLLKVDSCDLGGGDRGTVDVDGTDSRGWCALVEQRLGQLHVEDARRADGPGVAKNTVLVAVQVCEVGRVGSGREEGDAAVEGLLGLGAGTEAGGIAAGDKDHPLLNTRASSRGAGLDKLLVVGEGELRDLDIGDLCSGSVDRVGDRLERGRGGDGGGGGLGSLCEEALDLADNVLKERNLLRGAESRQGEKDGGGAHIGGEYACLSGWMKTGTSIEWKIKRQVAYAVMEMELKELYQRVNIRVLSPIRDVGRRIRVCRARMMMMTYSSEDETDTDKSRTIDAAEDR